MSSAVLLEVKIQRSRSGARASSLLPAAGGVREQHARVVHA
jgi:hypothetical protein